jgi:hypothetical protein
VRSPAKDPELSPLVISFPNILFYILLCHLDAYDMVSWEDREGNRQQATVQTKEFGVWRSEARGSEIGGDHEKDAPYVVNLVEISGARTNG